MASFKGIYLGYGRGFWERKIAENLLSNNNLKLKIPSLMVVIVRILVTPRGARAAALLWSIKNDMNDKLTINELGIYMSFI